MKKTMQFNLMHSCQKKKKRKIILKNSFLFLILFISFHNFSQSYWQQEVNYKIDVSLDDVHHRLSAFESFEYINHSPDTLNFIFIHLWPNAYKSEKTALGKQLWEKGNKMLKFTDSINKGEINGLDFKVNNQSAKVYFDELNPDICKLMLPTNLLPNQKVIVSTPFNVKIPSGEISRLGHIGQSYQITQWYPKPAVYDKNGWNEIPYLNQGEFYSEYGSFDVSITLPSNYVVAATGDLQTESEIEFLNDKVDETQRHIELNTFNSNDELLSDENKKTIRYTQDKVHDFAWFADKSYEVLKGEVELPHSKRKVTSWAMFTPANAKVWANSIEYINDGTYYYSLWNGDYPYNNVTAVDGTISAGGGMEYPTVTVIGNTYTKEDLEIVIVHEVGHNWFYGILGSNERKHGWMDEGLNTLNEIRYIQTKYPNNSYFSDQFFNSNFHFEDLSHHDNADISYQLLAMLGEDQPIETSSEDFNSINYGVVMYQKTGLIFFYLKAYLGEEIFDECMSAYFEKWKFKHPQPEDLVQLFEEISKKDLKWMFEDLIKTTNHIDYKLKRVKVKNGEVEVKIKNIGQVDGPIPVGFYKGDSLVREHWFEPGLKVNKLNFKDSSGIDFVIIDKENNIPEMNRSNNQWNKKWIFNKFEPLRFEFLAGDNDQLEKSNFWMPIVVGNRYDRTMLGMVLHNYTMPSNRFQYLISPLYSFKKNGLSGVGEFSYVFLPKKNFKLIRLGSSIKSFKNQDDFYFQGTSNYANVSPYLFMKIGNRKAASKFDNTLLIQSIYNTIFSQQSRFEEVGGFLKYTSRYRTADVKAELELRNDLMNNLTNKDQLGRISVELGYHYRYAKNKHDRWIDVRMYLGVNYLFSQLNATSNRYQLSLSGVTGNQDLFYEDYFFARTSITGTYAGQQVNGMGNFKSRTNLTSNKWLGTVTTYFQLPINPNVFGVFSDFGFVESANQSIALAYNTGLGIKLGEFLGVYFPLYNSVNMGDLYDNYANSIRFSLKMNIVNIGFRMPNLF